MHDNLARNHKTIQATPAMQAKIAAHVWGIEEIVLAVPDSEGKKCGPNKTNAAC